MKPTSHALVKNCLGGKSENLLLSATPVVIFSITWTNILKDRDQPLIFTILYPLLFINIIVIGILSAIKTGFGKGVEWKGRYVKCGTRSGYTNK